MAPPPIQLFLTTIASQPALRQRQEYILRTLQVKKIPFLSYDLASDEDAKRLWRRKAPTDKQQLPGILVGGRFPGTFQQFEEAVEFDELEIFLRQNEEWKPFDSEKALLEVKPIGVPGAYEPLQMFPKHAPSRSPSPSPLKTPEKKRDPDADILAELGLDNLTVSEDDLRALVEELGLGGDEANDLVKGLAGDAPKPKATAVKSNPRSKEVEQKAGPEPKDPKQAAVIEEMKLKVADKKGKTTLKVADKVEVKQADKSAVKQQDVGAIEAKQETVKEKGGVKPDAADEKNEEVKAITLEKKDEEADQGAAVQKTEEVQQIDDGKTEANETEMREAEPEQTTTDPTVDGTQKPSPGQEVKQDSAVEKEVTADVSAKESDIKEQSPVIEVKVEPAADEVHAEPTVEDTKSELTSTKDKLELFPAENVEPEPIPEKASDTPEIVVEEAKVNSIADQEVKPTPPKEKEAKRATTPHKDIKPSSIPLPQRSHKLESPAEKRPVRKSLIGEKEKEKERATSTSTSTSPLTIEKRPIRKSLTPARDRTPSLGGEKRPVRKSLTPGTEPPVPVPPVGGETRLRRKSLTPGKAPPVPSLGVEARSARKSLTPGKEPPVPVPSLGVDAKHVRRSPTPEKKERATPTPPLSVEKRPVRKSLIPEPGKEHAHPHAKTPSSLTVAVDKGAAHGRRSPSSEREHARPAHSPARQVPSSWKPSETPSAAPFPIASSTEEGTQPLAPRVKRVNSVPFPTITVEEAGTSEAQPVPRQRVRTVSKSHGSSKSRQIAAARVSESHPTKPAA